MLASATLHQPLPTSPTRRSSDLVDGLYDLSSASTTNVFASGTAALIHVVSGGELLRSGAGTASINVPVQNDGRVDAPVASALLNLTAGSGGTNATGVFGEPSQPGTVALTAGTFSIADGAGFEG